MLLIHKYIIKQFVNTLIFALVALCTIFVIVNLLENLDDFLDAKADIGVIFLYYLNYLPEILKLLTPVGVLISSLFTVGKLSNLNEITAMKTGGMSLYRIMFPYIVLCIFISGLQLYFNGWIVPKSNEKVRYIEIQYLKESKNQSIYNLFYRDSPKRNIILSYFDAENKTATGISIDEYSSNETPRLISRTSGSSMSWDSLSNQWVLKDVIQRRIYQDSIVTQRFTTLYPGIYITASQISSLQKDIKEMTFTEIREYIDLLKKGGKDVTQMETDYYSGYAFPFSNLIIILFAVPFASVKKKNGLAVQIASAMIISFFYLIFQKLGQSIGNTTSLNPIISGWLANIIFLIFGIIVLFRTKT